MESHGLREGGPSSLMATRKNDCFTRNIHPMSQTLDIEAEIANWVAWARTRAGRSVGQCASIEHRYRPPRHWWPDPLLSNVNIRNALDVERAMGDVPEQHRAGLVMHYARRAPSAFICRKLGLRPAAWEQFLADGRTMLKNILLRSGKWRISSVVQFDSSLAETLAPMA